MGRRNGDFVSEEEKSVSDSLSDLLLFTTMCIIGFPVDVLIKDGSIYSGTFYTACLDHEYAIVLKRARMTKKGNRQANVPNGCLIETLIIQAEDLVQVVAKDISFPAEGIPRKGGAGDGCALAIGNPRDLCRETAEKATSLPSRPIEGLAGENPEGRRSNPSAEPKFQIEQVNEVQAFRSSVDACDAQPNLSHRNNEGAEVERIPNLSFEKSSKDPKLERLSSDRSGNPAGSAPVAKLRPTSSPTPTKLIPPKTAKDFNLNPKAKVFCPSSVMHRSATPQSLATLANLSYVPGLLPVVVPTASAQPAIDTNSYSHRSSTPAKYLPQNNVVFGNGHVDQQYPQPVVNQVLTYVGSRTQPMRYASHYGHVQPGTGYMHPNTQNVMAGRWGPVVYVHPVSNDIVTHSPVRPSQVPAHAFLNPHSFNIAKHQAPASMQAMQLYMTPPLVANGMQPF